MPPHCDTLRQKDPEVDQTDLPTVGSRTQADVLAMSTLASNAASPDYSPTDLAPVQRRRERSAVAALDDVGIVNRHDRATSIAAIFRSYRTAVNR